ncbi:MAG: M23 family metallopeptidase [bacterium]|nr:M23 family metallopeptidase [bacterium]
MQRGRVHGYFLGDSLSFARNDSGFFGIGVVDVDQLPGEYWVKLYLDGKLDSLKLTVTHKKFREVRLRPPKKLRPVALTQRINEENEKIRMITRQRTASILWTDEFIPPVPGMVTKPFGVKYIREGKVAFIHRGIDLRAKSGEPVRAANDGIVVLVDKQYLPGKLILINHGIGLYTLYAHLNKIFVNEGDKVNRGDIIGLSGNTGKTIGPHLHFGAYLYSHPFDPCCLFKGII